MMFIVYEEVSWPRKLEISHASQILTNDHPISALSYLFHFLCTKLYVHGFKLRVFAPMGTCRTSVPL